MPGGVHGHFMLVGLGHARVEIIQVSALPIITGAWSALSFLREQPHEMHWRHRHDRICCRNKGLRAYLAWHCMLQIANHTSSSAPGIRAKLASRMQSG